MHSNRIPDCLLLDNHCPCQVLLDEHDGCFEDVEDSHAFGRLRASHDRRLAFVEETDGFAFGLLQVVSVHLRLQLRPQQVEVLELSLPPSDERRVTLLQLLLWLLLLLLGLDGRFREGLFPLLLLFRLERDLERLETQRRLLLWFGSRYRQSGFKSFPRTLERARRRKRRWFGCPSVDVDGRALRRFLRTPKDPLRRG